MEAWQNPHTFAIGLGIVLGAFLLLVAFVFVLSRLYTRRMLREQAERNRIKLQHQKSLINASVDTQEKERARIAADLHDDLVSRLRAVHLMLSTGTQIEGKDPLDMLSQGIELTREISHDLMPPMLDHSTIDELLEEAAFILKENHDLKIYVLGSDNCNVSRDLKLQFFRIVKEVINNIDKHAQANRVNILLRQSRDSIILTIRDNGKGMPDKIPNCGLGMKNIELRCQKISAKFKFKSQGLPGTTFILYIPTQSEP